MTDTPFASPEAASYWRFIASSLDRLVALATTIDNEGRHWQPPAPAANSVATLTMHTLGNAEENILGTLCGQAVERDRAREFEVQTVSAADIKTRWDSLRPRLATALAHLPDGDLDRQQTHPRRGALAGREVLLVVARHAAEHLGQAELTRDLWAATRS